MLERFSATRRGGSQAIRRFDVLIHALAQLPDNVTLELRGCADDHGRLEQLAQAYAIDDRVSFVRPGPPRAQFVRDGSPLPFEARGEAEPATMAELLNELDANGAAATRRDRDAVLAGERVTVVTNYPAPYRIPLFNGIAERLEAVGARLSVVVLADRSAGRPWMRPADEPRFDRRTLRTFTVPGMGRGGLLPLNLEATLIGLRPTLIVCPGYSPMDAARVAAYAGLRRIPYGLWSGEIEGTDAERSRVRRPLRRWLARRASFGLAYGHAGSEYLHDLRPELPVVYVRNTAWEETSLPAASSPASDSVELLMVGDLASPRKGTDLAIDAMLRVPDLSCRLTIIGEGALASSLRERAAGDRRISFTGALSRPEVFEAYRRADAFLFPTRSDIFGLVLVEAMGSGLACAVSSAPGALADLCVPERNTLVVAEEDPELWAQAIQRLVTDSELRRRLGEDAARTVAHRWTMRHSVDAWLAAFRLGVSTR